MADTLETPSLSHHGTRSEEPAVSVFTDNTGLWGRLDTVSDSRDRTWAEDGVLVVGLKVRRELREPHHRVVVVVLLACHGLVPAVVHSGLCFLPRNRGVSIDLGKLRLGTAGHHGSGEGRPSWRWCWIGAGADGLLLVSHCEPGVLVPSAGPMFHLPVLAGVVICIGIIRTDQVVPFVDTPPAAQGEFLI